MRSRAIFSIAAFLLLGSLIASCARIRLIGDNMAEDAKHGAAVGFTIGGPEGAAIGSVLMAAIGAFVRSREKKSLRNRGLLTDKQNAITVRTEKPRQDNLPTTGDNSGQYPQQEIGL